MAIHIVWLSSSFLFLSILEFVCGIGTYYEDSKGKHTWEQAKTACSDFGRSFRNVSENQEFISLNSQIPIESRLGSFRLPEQFWIGGYEVFTPWISIKGCYTDHQHPEAIINKTTIPNNQAKRCSTFCSWSMWTAAILQNSTCECRLSTKSFADSRKCKTRCPGNTEETCGGPQVYSIYTKHHYSPDDDNLCLSASYYNNKWHRKPRNCFDRLKYIYKVGARIIESKSEYDWFSARRRTEKGGLSLYDNYILDVRGANISVNADYWIGIFRNKTIIWNKATTLQRTGRCVTIKQRTHIDWVMELQYCSDKFRYKCEKIANDSMDNSPAFPEYKPNHPNTESNTGGVVIHSVTPVISGSTDDNLVTMETVTSIVADIQKDYQLYIYIAVALGSALIVCAVFICIITVKRCLATKPKENTGNVTVTTDVSEDFNESCYANSNPGLKTDEPIYDEIKESAMDIQINTYSEPLPLKDPVGNSFKREYAEPYDSLKHGVCKKYSAHTGKQTKALFPKNKLHADNSYIIKNGQLEKTSNGTNVDTHYSSVKDNDIEKQSNTGHSLQYKDISNHYFILEPSISEYS